MHVDTADGHGLSIDAGGLHYSELNRPLREAVADGAQHIELHNVFGQRYIGTDLQPAGRTSTSTARPATTWAPSWTGPRIVVHGNAQDGCGNTMNDGEIIVHGHAGDIVGLSARGGKIFVRDDVGYRAGIHMKEYEGKRPALVIGGTAQDFLGEYMAGGVLVVLGLNWRRASGTRPASSAPACTAASSTCGARSRTTSWARRWAWPTSTPVIAAP